MEKTLIALDKMLAWYITQLHGFMSYDFSILEEQTWMHFTVIPMIIYSIFMILKWILLWGMITIPLYGVAGALGNVILTMRGGKKKDEK